MFVLVISLRAEQFRVAIDIGHEAEYQLPDSLDIRHATKSDLIPSGHSGCLSARGQTEHFFNYKVAMALYKALNDSGIYAFLLNPRGKKIELMDRCRLANKYKADLLISIHHDSTEKKYLHKWKFKGKTCYYCPDKFRGYSVYVSSKSQYYKQSKELAIAVGKKLSALGFKPNDTHKPTKSGDRRIINKDIALYNYKNLVVLKHSKSPSILIESGVIRNKKDETLVSSPKYRRELVNAVVESVKAYKKKYYSELMYASN